MGTYIYMEYQMGCALVQIVILVLRLNNLRTRPWQRSSLGKVSLTGCALCMRKSTILVLLCTKLLRHNYSIILMALALRPKCLILKNGFKFCVDDKSLMVVTRSNSYNISIMLLCKLVLHQITYYVRCESVNCKELCSGTNFNRFLPMLIHTT